MNLNALYRGATGLTSAALAIGSSVSPFAQTELWTGAGVDQTRTFTDS